MRDSLLIQFKNRHRKILKDFTESNKYQIQQLCPKFVVDFHSCQHGMTDTIMAKSRSLAHKFIKTNRISDPNTIRAIYMGARLNLSECLEDFQRNCDKLFQNEFAAQLIITNGTPTMGQTKTF
ncbi:hypothetical protein [Sediminicola luteus]|uniref:Uncharacterized protein n=1 Tax=Sediminicola luteus TaxID=319238 RepID=A0A2A4G3F9_9FLAO|nr:hypothetical protein [Sediminicola luteus]PCE62514.1 hypothetical protein B7P33_17920 [Sediminicola luteus]